MEWHHWIDQLLSLWHRQGLLELWNQAKRLGCREGKFWRCWRGIDMAPGTTRISRIPRATRELRTSCEIQASRWRGWCHWDSLYQCNEGSESLCSYGGTEVSTFCTCRGRAEISTFFTCRGRVEEQTSPNDSDRRRSKEIWRVQHWRWKGLQARHSTFQKGWSWWQNDPLDASRLEPHPTSTS